MNNENIISKIQNEINKTNREILDITQDVGFTRNEKNDLTAPLFLKLDILKQLLED